MMAEHADTAENDVHCEHAHVKTFRSYPPRSVCQDCGRDVKLSWCDPAAEPAARAPIPPGSGDTEGSAS